MSAAGGRDAEYVQHGKEASSGSGALHNRAGTGQSNEEHHHYYDEGDGYDDDDDDFLNEYAHERLPTEPQRLDLELPEANLDLTMTFNSILKGPDPPEDAHETERVQKRASNVMKLAEQNEKLKAELRAMTERLEAAERRQKDLEARRSAEGAGGAH
ncbi:hypothetical protein BD309DRAFT_944751 [Dichomitus squalens]|nr:hypothetical protein BD309DRAFT_944751 [Dichomitus squalens]